MNVLFFLTPKNKVEYVFEDTSLRQILEKMDYHGFSAVPILNKENEYVGTLTASDLLLEIKKRENFNLKDAEDIKISSIKRSRNIEPIYIDNEIDDLISKASNQNFIPVLDDYNKFIGIITRKDIILYCYKKMTK